jgi:hypothetical protein
MSDFEVINLSEVTKAKRGATASYDADLLAALTALKKGQAIRATSLAVARDAFKDEDAFKNAKQTVGANIRKHWHHLVDTKAVGNEKISISWDVETGAPQIFIKE